MTTLSGSGTSRAPHVAPASRTTPATVHTPRKQTFFYILAADQEGTRLRPLVDETSPPPPQDPSDDDARQIDFHFRRDAGGPTPRDQLEFVAGAERILHALNHLYPAGARASAAQFRLFYVRVFRLACLVLEEGIQSVDAGKAELAAIEKDLVHDEGPGVKNKHIWGLVRSAAWLGVPAATAYVVLSRVARSPGGRTYQFLDGLHVDPATLANFMLLWLGCFLGVCLSYALRKHDFTVDDLVSATEPDLLRPMARLAFAGTLAMLLVMFSMLHIVDVQVGPLMLSHVTRPDGQMLAFLVGVVCGISELLLPSKVVGPKGILASA